MLEGNWGSLPLVSAGHSGNRMEGGRCVLPVEEACGVTDAGRFIGGIRVDWPLRRQHKGCRRGGSGLTARHRNIPSKHLQREGHRQVNGGGLVVWALNWGKKWGIRSSGYAYTRRGWATWNTSRRARRNPDTVTARGCFICAWFCRNSRLLPRWCFPASSRMEVCPMQRLRRRLERLPLSPRSFRLCPNDLSGVTFLCQLKHPQIGGGWLIFELWTSLDKL